LSQSAFLTAWVTNEIHPPGAQCPSHTSQPHSPVFSHADAVKSRRASSH